MMARSLMQALALAVMEMRSRRHECLTVEHLLLAMTREQLGRVILKGCGADIPALRHQLEEYLSRYLPATGPEPSAESEVLQTEALEMPSWTAMSMQRTRELVFSSEAMVKR